LEKAMAWGALAYFWFLINDQPVNADSILGRQGHFFMEVVLNSLSLSCFILAAREVAGGGSGRRTTWRVASLAVMAFLVSSADDSIGLILPGLVTPGRRYPFEAVTLGASLVLFYFMLREGRIRGPPSEFARS